MVQKLWLAAGEKFVACGSDFVNSTEVEDIFVMWNSEMSNQWKNILLVRMIKTLWPLKAVFVQIISFPLLAS